MLLCQLIQACSFVPSVPQILKKYLGHTSQKDADSDAKDHANPLFKGILLVDLILVEKNLFGFVSVLLRVCYQQGLNLVTTFKMPRDGLHVHCFS